MQPEAQVQNPQKCSPNTALAAFMARKLEIDTMLQRLADFSADHFGVDPDEVDWGHVGTLAHHAEPLRRVSDDAFHEGDHAA